MSCRQSGQILIVLLGGGLLLGGSGLAAGVFLTGKTTSELRKETVAMVADTGRRQRIEAVFKRWEREVDRIDAARDKNLKAIFELGRRHDATAAEFERVYAAADTTDADALKTALDMRFALRGELSADEWRRLFPQK